MCDCERMFADEYDECFYRVGKLYLSKYESGKLEINVLMSALVPKEILSTLYAIMIKNKMIEPLENMSPEDKQALWLEAKPFTKGMDKNGCMKVVRSIWVLLKLSQLEMQK